MKIKVRQLRRLIREAALTAGLDLDLLASTIDEIINGLGSYKTLEQILGNANVDGNKIIDIVGHVSQMEKSCDEARSSPEEYNAEEFEAAFKGMVGHLIDLTGEDGDEIANTLEDHDVSFPYSEWEEGMADRQNDENEDDGEEWDDHLDRSHDDLLDKIRDEAEPPPSSR